MSLLLKFNNIIIIFFLFFFSTCGNSEEIFLSLKKNKVNVRYGPSFESPIKFVYKKINLPIKQIDRKENFRRIIDFKNNSGWIHISQLKKSKSFIVTRNKILFRTPTLFSKPIARIQKGRLLKYKDCKKNWCNVKTAGFNGWIKTDSLWGKTQ